jgi:dimethylargininase
VLTAITRAVSPAMNRCELAFLERQEIDIALAMRQHRKYEAALESLGVRVISLPAELDLPDSVFVEDPAVVVDEVAVVARMGAESRRREAETLAKSLEPFRPLWRMHEPAMLEGGDVFRIGRTVFAGLSQRTNEEGIRQLGAALQPFGYSVQPVEVRGCLHLKSGACYLGDSAILVNREWVDAEAFRDFRLVNVVEPRAADVLTIGDTVLMPDCYPETRRVIERQGWTVRPLDVSELMKAEAGVTCMSVIFDA